MGITPLAAVERVPEGAIFNGSLVAARILTRKNDLSFCIFVDEKGRRSFGLSVVPMVLLFLFFAEGDPSPE